MTWSRGRLVRLAALPSCGRGRGWRSQLQQAACAAQDARLPFAFLLQRRGGDGRGPGPRHPHATVCVLVWTCSGPRLGVGAPSCQGGVESPPRGQGSLEPEAMASQPGRLTSKVPAWADRQRSGCARPRPQASRQSSSGTLVLAGSVGQHLLLRSVPPESLHPVSAGQA